MSSSMSSSAKPQTAPVPIPEPAAPPVLELIAPSDLVDEYGDLDKLRKDFAPTESKYQKAVARLKALVADADPAAEFRVRGSRYTLRISARGFERVLDIPAVRKRLGALAFIEAATVTFAALKNYLLAPEIEKLTTTEQTGHRKFEPTPIEGKAA